MNCALSAYPVSQNFQAKLEAAVGEPIRFMLLSELRSKRTLNLWSFLRALQPNKLFLLLEDQNSQVLLPILQLVAKLARPKEIVIVHSNLVLQRIKSSDVVRASFLLLYASLQVRFNYQRSLGKINNLLGQSITNDSSPFGDAKKILYLNANLWFGVKAGGSVGHIAGVVNAFVNKGLEVDYAAVDKSPLLSESVNQIHLPAIGTFGLPSELNYYYFDDKVVSHLLNAECAPKWGFIYQRMSVANFSGVSLSRQLNIPLILEYNGSEAWVAKNWGKGLRYHDTAIQCEEICLKHARTIVTISEVLRQELIERGVRSEKIVYYPNCIDPALFNPQIYTKKKSLALREKHNIPADSIVLTFVGTFGQWHGVDILAKTIQLLIESHEIWLQLHKVHFLLVGDGFKMPEVKRILGDYMHKPYITLTGIVPQAEAPAYLAASDILLSPHIANADGSQFFGSPTKLFEYMAMGKAIIASDLEQIGEVLINSLRVDQLRAQQTDSTQTELSVLCEPGNVQQLLEAMQFLVENQQWRDILGRNVRREALAKYTWEQHVGAFLYREKKDSLCPTLVTN